MTRPLKILVFVTALLGLTLGGIFIFRPKPTPIPIPQTTIEVAAQHAVTAIVAVAKAKTAHQRHVLAWDSVRAILDGIDTMPLRTPKDSALVRTVTILAADNARLDSALTTTAAALAPDTLVHIKQDSTPATPLKIAMPSLGGKILSTVGKALLPTVGYGATYDGTTLTHGPSATIGLHLTSGTIGVTAGVTATYANSAVHLGVGATVGVRL